MRRTFLLKSMLLLCALVAGMSSAWGQSDYSALYTSNVTLPSSGTNVSSCVVVINNTNYDGVKLGKSGSGASCTITAPKDTKYIHLHIAGWNGKSPGFNYKVGSGSEVNISGITSDSGIANSSPFTFSGNANTSDYYKVITLANSLTEATTITLKSTSERVVIWGVNSEAASNDPSSEATFTNTTPSINFPATKTYSQVPTTAEGYNGTISYSMTANTAGATIDSSTGLVTVTKGGSVTVKALAAAVSGKFSGSEATYTLTVNDTRTSAGLAWSSESANVTYGADNNIFPTLTNPHNVSVSYTSSNQAAATIDENGTITLKDYTGNTTISAIFDGNDDYLDQTVTYTLNVTKAPFAIKDGVFDFVEAAGADPLEDYESGVTLSTGDYTTGDKTWTAGNVTMVTSDGGGSGIRWWKNDGTLRFYNKAKATFSVPDGYVITKIVTTGANFDSKNVGTLSGTTWKGAANEVVLSVTATRNIETITITYTTENQTLTPAKEYTTLTSAYALDFTNVEGLKAYIATSVADNKVQTMQVNKVPANTGLVLVKSSGTSFNVPVFDGTGADDVSANKMVGSATATTAVEANGGYILKDGEFHPATAGTLAAGKAYLKIAVANSNAPLEIDLGETTGVSTLNVERGTLNGEVYNLNGQRVAQPTKGLYIVNGKKIVIK